MSAFAIDVLELGSPAAAAPLWHGEHGYRRADLDPPLTVRPTVDGFEVRTSVSGGGDNISRKGVMRYSVTATGVHRVEPLAMNGRDSIVEWLELPRKEAAEFADESTGSLTWQMFQEFTYEGKGREGQGCDRALSQLRRSARLQGLKYSFPSSGDEPDLRQFCEG